MTFINAPLQAMINHDELIEKTNTILDGVSRLKQEWECLS